MHPVRSLLFLAGLTLASLAAQAQPAAPSGGGSGQPPGPPPEAVQACVGKKAGDTASATGRDGRTLTGTCESRDGVLALRPSRPAGGQPPT